MKMKMKCALIFVGLGLLFSARATTVVDQLHDDGGDQVQYFALIGQRFTTMNTNLVSATFWFAPLNPDCVNNTLILSLYAGDDVSGALLDTQVFSLPDCYADGHSFSY
jgi:hypothetical protein